MPRVFDRIYAGAMSKIEEKGGLAAKLFKWGYSRKSARLKRNIPADRVSGMAGPFPITRRSFPSKYLFWYEFRFTIASRGRKVL